MDWMSNYGDSIKLKSWINDKFSFFRNCFVCVNVTILCIDTETVNALISVFHDIVILRFMSSRLIQLFLDII